MVNVLLQFEEAYNNKPVYNNKLCLLIKNNLTSLQTDHKTTVYVNLQSAFSLSNSHVT